MIYLSIGSNLGNRLANLRQAVHILRQKLEIIYESIILETAAILPENSAPEWNRPYMNMIVVVSSGLSPENLLNLCKNIEHKMGRKRVHQKWAPRTIDLDILMYKECQLDSPILKIPHPEMINRSFIFHLLATLPERYIPKITISGKNVKQIAEEWKANIAGIFDKSYTLTNSSFVGIINVTPDSFSDGGKNYSLNDAFDNCQELVSDGAEVLDIGAQSTSPGKIEISCTEEFSRLSPILAKLADANLGTEISIDCYKPQVIRKILENYKVDWINDVSGTLPQELLQEIASAKCKIVVMNSVDIPENRVKHHDITIPIIDHLRLWILQVTDRLLAAGFNKEDIILDPGIGFGKTIYQNINLLQSLKDLTDMGYPLLVGHSRKSFITAFSKADLADRDLETIAASSYLDSLSVNYLRVHNVKDHHRFFVTEKLLNSC